MIKRTSWTEADVIALGPDEQDIFERKAGQLYAAGMEGFQNTLAKALSAFANSGGGSIVLGMADDGSFDGLPSTVGRSSMRDWVEMKIPPLLDYPLSDFRVHTVIPSTPSQIPEERVVLVIDVGDSAAAPHQSKRDKIYYRREGGRSVPAPHFYIELLRQRLTSPKLEAEEIACEVDYAYETADEPNIIVVIKLNILIRNVGRVVATHWAINVRELSWPDDVDFSARAGCDVMFSNFLAAKAPRSRSSYTRVGSRAILPDCAYPEELRFALRLRPQERSADSVAADFGVMISDLILRYQIATESSPGTLVDFPLASACDRERMVSKILSEAPEFLEG